MPPVLISSPHAVRRLYPRRAPSLGSCFTSRWKRPRGPEGLAAQGASHQVSLLSLSEVNSTEYLIYSQGNRGCSRRPQRYGSFSIEGLSGNEHCVIAMLMKVQTVQKEVDKLVSGNETLQMYIDNLTVQMAKRR